MADLGGDGLGRGARDDLERWAAGARARDAADSRMRERWLRQQAAEDSSMRGVLATMAAEGEPVAINTGHGERVQAVVLGVGRDFVALGRDGEGGERLVLLALADVDLVSTVPGPMAAPARQHNGFAPQTGLAEVAMVEILTQACAHRPLVRARVGTTVVVGELQTVGSDLVVLRTEGPASGPTYVAVASLSEVSFLGSG